MDVEGEINRLSRAVGALEGRPIPDCNTCPARTEPAASRDRTRNVMQGIILCIAGASLLWQILSSRGG